MGKRPKLKVKTINFLEEKQKIQKSFMMWNLEENRKFREELHDVEFSKDFLHVTSKAQATQEKKETNWTASKLKLLCIKELYYQSTRQHT